MGQNHCSHLSDVRLDTDKDANTLKKGLLDGPATEITNKVFSQTKQERKRIWKKMGGLEGAHLLSFHFYRRIYENDKKSKQTNHGIKKFCTLFTDRPFAQAVDRVSRFMGSELNGEASFWSVQWIDSVHCGHAHAKHIMAPLAAQMWFSFLCSALTECNWPQQVQEDVLTFFKDCMYFLFMDTWVDCKLQLQSVPMSGLLNEGKERIAHWEYQYQINKHD